LNKKVLCSDCGFLCWHISDVRDEFGHLKRWGEAPQYNRKELDEGSLKATDDDYENYESSKISCLRHQWIFFLGSKDQKYNFVSLYDIKELRKCRYFFKYVPGSGPEEHKELERDKKNRDVVRNAALMGAGIGGLISTIGYCLYNIFI